MLSLIGVLANMQNFLSTLPLPIIIVITLLILPLVLSYFFGIPVSILLTSPFYEIMDKTRVISLYNNSVILILLAVLIGSALRAWLSPPRLIVSQLKQNRYLISLPWLIALISLWALIYFVPSTVLTLD
jgi:hypothetical protein